MLLDQLGLEIRAQTVEIGDVNLCTCRDDRLAGDVIVLASASAATAMYFNLSLLLITEVSATPG
jgi:hypothetical protein